MSYQGSPILVSRSQTFKRYWKIKKILCQQKGKIKKTEKQRFVVLNIHKNHCLNYLKWFSSEIVLATSQKYKKVTSVKINCNEKCLYHGQNNSIISFMITAVIFENYLSCSIWFCLLKVFFCVNVLCNIQI